MIKQQLIFLVVLIFGISLGGCSNTGSSNVSSKENTKNDTSPIKVLDLQAVSALESILPKLKGSRVVSVGETHTNYSHHLNQLEIIKALHANWGNKTSIGLEMIQRPYQKALDYYINGKSSELEMLKSTEWYNRWKYDFRLYRPIFDYAKKHKIPLIALNIPTELTKRISKVGIEGLNQSERAQLPKIIDKSNVSYEKRLKEVYSMHSHSKEKNGKGFKNFVDAQLAWDEGMAMTATNYLKKNTDKSMILLAGEGHLVNRDGIPSSLDRQLGIRSVVILNQQYDAPSKNKGDFQLFSKDRKLPPLGMIGIGMKSSKGGVKVTQVLAKSAAAKAGLKKNDLIVQLENNKIEVPSDISLWRLDKKPGLKVNVGIKRNGQFHEKILILGKPSPNSSIFSLKK